MLPEFKIYQPIQFGIFLTFATIKVVGEPKQQNLISAKKFVKRTGCLQPSNSLLEKTWKIPVESVRKQLSKREQCF